MAYRYNPLTGKLDYFDNPVPGNLTIGIGGAGVDYSLTFDGESSDGVVVWMEDEDYFLFNDTIFMFDAKPIYFRSTQSYIYSENAGIITLVGATNVDLVTNAVVIGKNIDEDISVTFNAASNDGVLTWMEDEDYFKFSDDVLIPAGENIYLVDTNTYLRHDGTNLMIADDTKINLFSNAITFGTTVDSDITLTFQANSNTGILKWMEDEDYFEFSDVIRAATNLYRRYYHISLDSANPGASGATWVNPGANSTGGWRLDANTEVLHGDVDIHSDWDGASNLTVEVRFYVNVDNTGGGVGDTVDLRIIAYYKGTGETVTKTQTVEVATVVGQSAQYKAFKAHFAINYDEVGNVIEAGDVLGILLNLETDTSEVDDIVVTGISFSYPTTHVGIESGDI